MTSSRASSTGCLITPPTHLSHMNELGTGKRSKHEQEHAYTESMLEVRAFEEDLRRMSNWPPRSYRCSFCRRIFTSAQALGGHMNVHRRDRARYLHSSSKNLQASSSSVSLDHMMPYDLNTKLNPDDLIASSNEASLPLAYPSLHSLSCPANFDTPTPLSLFHKPSTHKILCAPTSCKNLAGSNEKPFLSATKASARSPPLEALPLLKEKCRCHLMCSKSSTNTKANTKYCLHQPISLNTSSNTKVKSSNSFDCKGSHHETRPLLLKDTLSSCNIVDLELRLGQKNGA